MREFHRPVIVVSKCLGFAPVRYNGEVIPDRFVRSLKDRVDFIPVCPEVEIGLGVPRKTVRVVLAEGERRLIQPDTGRDVTAEMEEFTARFLDSLPEVDGFIMKSRSPSSGIKDVKIYPGLEKVAAVGKGAGFFGGAVIDRFSPLAIEDEGRLTNFSLREAFLTRIFAHAELRSVIAGGRMRDLVGFHARHKYLLMAYNQKELRALGRIVANAERLGFGEVASNYEAGFSQALARTPRRSSVVNVLQHMAGYFKKRLSPREKEHFGGLVGRYKDGELPLSAVLSVLTSWTVKYETGYIEDQTFFEPFPEGLIGVRDSGKGVDR